MKKFFLSLLAIIGISHFSILHTNAGAALIGPSIFGILQIFTFPSWILAVLFGICVLIDYMILKDHIKRRKGLILVSIGGNGITAVGAGFMLFYLSSLLAFGFKHVSETCLFALTILLLAFVTLFDVIIQISICNLLFSVTHLKQLFFKLFISGFFILASIVLTRIVLHI